MLESRICIAWWGVKTGTKRGMTGGSWRLNTENVQRLDRTLAAQQAVLRDGGSAVLLWVHHWLLDDLSEVSQALGTPCHLRLSPFRNHVLAPVIWNQFFFSPLIYWCLMNGRTDINTAQSVLGTTPLSSGWAMLNVIKGWTFQIQKINARIKNGL